MSELPRRLPNGAPYNPGVRELVSAKRRCSSPPSREDALLGFRGWHERGFLAHRDEPGLTQFVTFRLADSFPAALRSEWEHLLAIEDDRECARQLEIYLDKGRGSCHLSNPAMATLVEESFRFFHRQCYELKTWVIMPNHVHVLFKVGQVPMSDIVAGRKNFTSKEGNRLLGRRGALWAEDYWDVFMRDAAHERKTIRYIENNPAKARLVRDPATWRWSSARFRDKFGVLTI